MNLAKTLTPLLAATMVVSVLAAPVAAQPGTYDQFFTFGDSLADSGNVWLTSKLLGVAPAPPPSTLGPAAQAIGGLPLVFWDVVHPTTYAHRKLADLLFAHLPR